MATSSLLAIILLVCSSFPLPSISVSLSSDSMKVAALSRFAVKGLGPSPLDSVFISNPGETFPDDRRFALLKKRKIDQFDASNPEWIHKENFLCAFTAPELMARYECEYRIVGCNNEGNGDANANNAAISYGEPWDSVGRADKSSSSNNDPVQRLLTIWERDEDRNSQKATCEPVLGPVDLESEAGRDRIAKFFSSISGEDVICVTADSTNKSNGSSSSSHSKAHAHQFGNTRSGVKARGDTRTVHLVNAETVRQLSEAIGVPLNPSRFRPNIVVEGLEPWAEFDMVGKTIVVENGHASLALDIISTTVRCDGVGVDPDDPCAGVLSIPALLSEHFPERGPYLGVYAVVRKGGRLKLGDSLHVTYGEVAEDRYLE